MESASKELEELFAVEQDINIKLIKIDELKDINLTMGQMQAILFMMDEEGI
jgi:predicted RNA-binding protein with RPS1 domain